MGGVRGGQAADYGGRRRKKLIGFARHYTDPRAMTCRRCADEERRFHLTPPCRAGQTCNLPILAPQNYLVWYLYLMLATQFCLDFDVSPLELMRDLGIPSRLLPILLRRLAIVYRIALDNQITGEGGHG
jgi:hypothetical protein